MSEARRTRVLIAEDDELIRSALASIVRSEPSLELVGEVSDGRRAAAVAQIEKPDVALVDVRMPDGGAVAVRKIIRSSPSTRVVVLSASADRSTVLEMLEAGALGYLVKGAPVETIVESILGAAAGRGSLSGQVTGDVISELVDQLQVQRRASDRRERKVARIRRAIEEEQALNVVYQPIWSLAGHGAVGFEALSRFPGPPRRSADRWFAEAESVGMRSELELVAVERALHELDRVEAGRYLSVNTSPETIIHKRLHELLTRQDPSRVVLEVTEHAAVDDYEKVNKALGRLRALGARLAIDDAGSGYASLQHILKLKPDIIKLDRALVQGIDDEPSGQALASGLISFAHRIGAAIVAEGIERQEDLDTLTVLGVHYGQGFLLARPASLAEHATV